MVSKEYFGEGKNIEFKRELPMNHEKFLKDIIAFSNSTGGQVIIGIEDETGIVYGIGEQSPFKLSDSISNMVSDACTPQIEPDISIRTLEGKTVLAVDIAPDKFRPYYLANKGKECSEPEMLYGGLDLETAKLGKSTCRNEAIAEAFQYMHIMETWGTGLPRIIIWCKEYGLPEPLFEEFGDGFKVTIFRKVSNAFEK